MAQQQISTPEDLIHYQVRSALTMEQHSLEALDELHAAAKDAKIKKLFSHHADETREQIANLTQVFKELGFDESSAPSPATTGIKNQAAALLEKAEPKLHNQIALMSALGNEHFEIAAYSGLILQATTLGASGAAKLLQENLDQEQHTSEELLSALQEYLA
ncbi:ferritin-like domain-containing protein [Leucobacter sp. NPDC058333]|uniref:YciE/YciF ferroxidase family protein n=1 Tax=Leucobacter sp. NPDC058333 TaxID=3346450 RepID=UPI00365B1221